MIRLDAWYSAKPLDRTRTTHVQRIEALAVLAAVLDRDGQDQSATHARDQALADADHLALLHAICADQITPARHRRYQDLLMRALPPGYRAEPGHQAKWLWRTLHAAELAGLDPAQVLAEAIAERDLAGSRDISAVLDARIRYRLGSLVPLPPVPWSAQVPPIADPGRRAYVTQIAALMDARKDRIGEHAAEHERSWAVAALGPVPAHPLDRLDWQKRAASIGAWRELSGYHHPAAPIGPEPVAAAPDRRAAWHEALAALGPSDGPDVRGMPDGMLWHPARHLPDRDRLGTPIRRRLSSARSAPPPGTPAWPACAPAPKPTPPTSAATTPKLPAGTTWPAATRPCTTLTGSAKPCSPPPWTIGPTGTRPPCSSGTWPWPPTPNCAAATPASTARRCGRRTRTRHRGSARRAHPGSRGAQSDKPVDQGPGRRRPHVRRPARGPAEPADPVPGPGLRGARPGVPALARTGRRRDLAATQARDPALGAGPRTYRQPGRRSGGRRLTCPGASRSPAGGRAEADRRPCHHSVGAFS